MVIPPDSSAWQTFYGTIPLILVIAAAFLRSQVLLKDIIGRLARIETWLKDAEHRITVLETSRWK